jgi:anthranilate phosphoribosyltransferase
VLKTTNSDFAIVHALDGYDEISLTDDVRIFTKKSMRLYEPKSLGFTKIEPSAIFGGKNLEENAKVFLSVLKGNGTDAQNNVVIANAAFAISLYKENSYLAALEDAQKSLFNGSALNSFEKLKSI